MRDFHGLLVWQKSHQLTLMVYRASIILPKDERFGLVSQLRRSAASIPANIAEGCGRGSDADFARFMQIAMGSASEVEYHLLLCKDLGFLTKEQWLPMDQAVLEVKRMLVALIRRCKGSGGLEVGSGD